MNRTVWIVAIGLLAFYLRVDAVNFGLPYLYHADEPILVNRALSYATGDLNPHYFKLPSFVSYVLFFCYGLYFLISLALGHISSVADFQNLFLSDPSSFYLLGRLVFGTVLGTASVVAFYFLIRRFFTPALAVAASFLFATNFLHIRNSHYLYLDVPLLFVIVLSFFPILNLLSRQKKSDYYLFGLLLGLAVSVKYNGFFIVVPFLYAHAVSSGKDPRRLFCPEIFGAAILSLFVFFALNPFAILDFKTFIRDLTSMHEFEGFQGWSHHLSYSLNHAMGLPALGLGLIGMLANIFRPERKKFAFVVFVLTYYVVLVHFSEQHARYVFPLIPFVLFFAGDILAAVTAGLKKIGGAVLAVAALTVAAPSLVKAHLCDKLLENEDVRTSALIWTEQNIPAGSRIALDSSFFMPRLKPAVDQLIQKEQEAIARGQEANVTRIKWMLRDAQTNPQTRYQLYFLNKKSDTEFLFGRPVLPYDVEALKQAGIEYVFVVRLNPEHMKSFYTQLDSSAEKIHRHTPYKDPAINWPLWTRPLTGAPLAWDDIRARARNGQIIDVYRLQSLRRP